MPRIKSSDQTREVTPLEAKRVWDNMVGPNPYKVAKAFKKAGRDISDDTIRRWRAQDWAGAIAETDIQKSVRQIDDQAATLLGDPELDEIALRDIIPPEIGTEFAGEREIFENAPRPQRQLMRLTDNRAIVEFIDKGSNLEVLRDTNRRAQGLFQVLCNEVDRQRDLLVGSHATEAASLINAMTNLLEAANRGMKHYLDVEERMMRVIEPNGTRGRGSLDDAVITDVNPFDFGAHSKSPAIQP